MSAPSTSQVVSPRARDIVRRWRYWVIVGVLLLVAATIWAGATGVASRGEPLSPSNPAPGGARALAQVLRSQGVEIVEPADLDAAIEAAPGATLLLHDPTGRLDDAGLGRLAESGAARIVLLDPSDATAAALAPGVTPSGATAGSADADCSDPLVERAETITGQSRLYRVSGDAEGCWADGPADFRVVFADEGRIAVVGTTGAFSNEQIALAGNAAFALGILGEHERLVWYRPTLADAGGTAPPSLGSLSPAWVVPLTVLGVIVFVAAAIWRGRRMGPLVVESLPAVVRADETMRGRARLYARAGARVRAADALRLGTLDRLAAACALPGSADVEQIATVVAALTGRPPTALRDLLRDRVPQRDQDLLQLGAELAELEDEVRRSTGAPGPTI